jgi:hypothetical protein
MHVDKFVDDYRQDEYARWMLMCFRLPAALQILASKFNADRRLFCTYEGKRYRCTGASRFGDVWLNSNFKRDCGYDDRVDVAKCSDWSAEP